MRHGSERAADRPGTVHRPSKRLWVALLAASLAAASTPSPTVAGDAGATLYGLVPTKACLVKRGAVVNTSSVPRLSASQQASLIVATMAASGSPPAFVYVVVAANGAQARTIRSVVAKGLPAPPTASNSRTGESENAAWLIESIVGGRPSQALATAVAACLRTGAPTALHLTRTGVRDCLDAGPAAVLQQSLLPWLGFPPIPSRIARSMVAALVPAAADERHGVFAFVLFGRSQAEALTLRGQLANVLRPSRVPLVLGQGHGAAWLTLRTKRATTDEAATARRRLGRCLG